MQHHNLKYLDGLSSLVDVFLGCQKSFQHMEESKKMYHTWPAQNIVLKRIKKIIKFLLPKTILEFREYLTEKKIDKLDYFKLNKKDSWCLRVLFKIN